VFDLGADMNDMKKVAACSNIAKDMARVMSDSQWEQQVILIRHSFSMVFTYS